MAQDAQGRPAGALGPTGQFLAGDPLRGFACVIIVVYHVAFGVVLSTTGVDDTYKFTATFGSFAQVIRTGDIVLWSFFALSAYLLSKPFIAALADGRAMPDTGRYVRNRLLRILPVFWLIYGLTLLRHGPAGSSSFDVLTVFGFAQTYNPSPAADLMGQAWTLNVEMAFYLLLPVAFGVLDAARRLQTTRAARLGLVLGLSAAIFLVSVKLRDPVLGSLLNRRNFLSMLFSLMPGVAFAALEVAIGDRLAARRAGRLLGVGALTASVALFALYLTLDPLLERTRSLVGVLCASALVGGLLVWQWATGGCPRVVDNRVGRWLGQRSYSIYLWHFAVGLEVGRVVGPDHGPWALLALIAGPALLITLGLSDLSYRFVEMPFLRLRKGWRHALGRERSEPVAPASAQSAVPAG